MTEPSQIESEPPSQRLARSRAELEALFEPPAEPAEQPGMGPAAARPGFPRSRTMKLLTEGHGRNGLAMLALALAATSPAKAVKLLRYVPMSAISKILVAQFLKARGANK